MDNVLLHYLDARVHATKMHPRISGTVCVGVRSRGRTVWWIARLGRKPTTELSAELPADFDAGIAVDPETAGWILGTADAPGPLHIKTGDQRLLQSLVKHYLQHMDMVGIRLGGAL